MVQQKLLHLVILLLLKINIFYYNKELKDLRKNIVELVLTDHPMECDTCEVDNNCELQTVANDLGIKEHN